MYKIYNYYAFSVCQNVLAKVDKRFQEGLKGPRNSSLDLANHTITTFANFFVKKLWTELANQKPNKQMSKAVWEGFEKMLNFPSTDDSRFVNVLIGVSTSFLSARKIAWADPTKPAAAAAAASWLEKVSIHFATELKRELHANILAYVNLSKPDCSSFCVACPTPCTRIGGRRTRKEKKRRRRRKKKKSRKSEAKHKYFGSKKQIIDLCKKYGVTTSGSRKKLANALAAMRSVYMTQKDKKIILPF